ncbi:MFS transporter [Mesobacillus zeae]|uniref:MFS transporter n=1 Tax=Mesobacillus zeae TaxID=1917180 RepID=A0A398AX86_9BACI|nr:MFS transporter [Mesobacillus zeae]RID82267.1 MFS transporter [Mesobacillus zeae]
MKLIEKRFIPLLLGVGISSAGDFMYLIAINILIFKLTGSSLAVAALWILGPLAGIVIKPWTGGFIDRFQKKQIMIITDIIRGILMLLLSFQQNVPVILFIIFLFHITSSFFVPASQAYIAKFLPEEQRGPFNGIYQAAQSGGLVIGPAVAGLLLPVFSPTGIIIINGLSFFISAILLAFLPFKEEANGSKERNPFWQTWNSDRKAVLHVIKEEHVFVKVYLTFQFMFIIGLAMDSLEWVYSSEVLGLKESQYSMLVSICGVGYLAGSLLSSYLSKWAGPRHLMTVGMLFSTLGYAGYAYGSSFLTALISFTILGIAQAIANTGLVTLYQQSIPSSIMARFSNFFAVIISFMIIGLTLLLGLFGEKTVSLAVQAPIIVTFALCILLFRFSSTLREEKSAAVQQSAL